MTENELQQLRKDVAELEAKLKEYEARLLFVMKNTAWTQTSTTDAGTTVYQLWSQNEDEEFYTLHEPTKFFKTPIEAIDQAMKG